MNLIMMRNVLLPMGHSKKKKVGESDIGEIAQKGSLYYIPTSQQFGFSS